MPQDDDQIAELLLRWEEAYEHGEDIPPGALCADCPELEPEVRRRVEALKGMAWVGEGLAGGTEGEGPDEGDVDNPSPIPAVLGGRYRVEGLIAEGGFGRVYRGYDPELQRPVAIKVPRPRQTAPEPDDHLLEEARRAAGLRCPGIVSVHDVGRDDGLGFIVSDLIDGENLADLIARRRPPPAEAATLVAEVAEALHFAHERGFVHRDIKPANILIDGQGRPLITDFGIAARLDDLPRGRGASPGTLPYMAPEQVAGEVQLIGPRTDVYALGVVLYELLAGRPPYQARTPTALREQILFRAPLPLHPPAGAIPPELQRVVLRCLAKHPADRQPSAVELARELRAATSPRPPVRRVLVPSALGTLTILTVAGLILVYRPSAPDRGPAGTRVGPQGTATKPEPASPVPRQPKVAPPTAEELHRPAIDLLPGMDPRRLSVGERWRRDGQALVSPPDPQSRIVIPHHPPREYILRAVVRRERGLDAIVLGLVTSDSQFAVVLDTGPGIVSGLALLDGAHLNNLRNETRFVNEDGVIPVGRPATILCTVRQAGVHVTCDGETIIDWTGRLERLSLPREWTVPDPRGLFIGSMEGIIRVESLEIIGL